MQTQLKKEKKCIAFLQRHRDIPSLKLCANDLPWVERGKHLGNVIENKDRIKKDTLVKRAEYIQKNNDLTQEFFFAHPDSKFEINMIFNSHFSGSSMWNIFSGKWK